jgi:superfamily II DNA/RNA helicase
MSTPDENSQIRTFADFGVDSAIVDALTEAGITSPFPIQELTLPLALSGADLIGQARTGTGKTLAFGIPLLQRVDPKRRETQALVIVPTRELCLQVADDLTQAGARKDVGVVAAYGGKAIDPQSAAIAEGAPIVVGTPGRLLDLVRRGDLHLGTVTGLVLDEADEMLDLGFLPDVEQLIQATASGRQTLLFSATMPSAVVGLARRYMQKPTFLRADVEEIRIAPETRQFFFSCHRMDKPAVLARILQAPDRGLCVVFTRTKRMADVLADELRGRGIDAAPIHSDLRQEARERALARFRDGKVDVLVATEVAARGLDIDDVTHVVNYDCPDDEKMYLHRIGRTGRAGAAGVAVTLAVWNEAARLEMIKKALDISDPTHEVFSTSPILDELFDLPERETRPNREVKPPAPRSQDKARSGGRRSRRDAEEAPKRKVEGPAKRKDEAAAKRKDDGPAKRETADEAPAKRETADEAPARRKSADDDSTPSRKRVRRRVVAHEEGRAQTEAPAHAEPTAAPQDTPAAAEPRDGERRRRTRVRVSPPAGEERRPAAAARGSAARSDSSKERRVRTDKPQERTPAARRTRDGGGSQRGHRGGSGRRGSGRPAPVVSPTRGREELEEVRGNGKPALNRPMTISHLP